MSQERIPRMHRSSTIETAGDPAYPLEILAQAIRVSIETQRIPPWTQTSKFLLRRVSDSIAIGVAVAAFIAGSGHLIAEVTMGIVLVGGLMLTLAQYG